MAVSLKMVISKVMSAGTGITHSEMNANADKPVKFLQIWVLTRKMA